MPTPKFSLSAEQETALRDRFGHLVIGLDAAVREDYGLALEMARAAATVIERRKKAAQKVL
ncbi:MULTISPECIES: hypothetical protein [unclassified Frondihabitans]|uniref:hypothetical protein n=1 Tax=unclassified Frondihabitans TaxID=2626248 RepID=UPI000F50C3A0|nr:MULTISPECIES: hypothetical protein [unclassified Frondihabitans]